MFGDSSRRVRGRSAPGRFLGFKEHLDLLKVDFNAAEIITVQDYNNKIYLFIFSLSNIDFS